MTTTHLAMKTIYTIKKLNSIYYGDKAQKRIFALSKTLKSIAQFHSLSSDLNDLHHAQITSIIQKSLHFDAFLCQTLKRLNTLLHPTTVLPRKSLKRFNKYNTKKQKSLQKFIASYSSIQFKNKNTFFAQVQFRPIRKTLPMITHSFFDYDSSSDTSEFSFASSLQWKKYIATVLILIIVLV